MGSKQLRIMFIVAAMVTAGVFKPVSQVSGENGLVAAYSFDEGKGSTVTDLSGNGNNGTITTPSWSGMGKYGKALVFGSGASKVTIPSSTSLNLTTGMTVEAWVYPTSSLPYTNTILMKERSTGPSYALYGNGSNNHPHAVIYSGNTLVDIDAGSQLSKSTWTHLAMTYDGATLRLYRNGVQVSSVNYVGSIVTAAQPLSIGGNSRASEHFTGRIDEVRVYNHALTAEEITMDMNTALTSTPSASDTPTMTATITITPHPSFTPTPTRTSTLTKSATPTRMPTFPWTMTPTPTASFTSTGTDTLTQTGTATFTPTEPQQSLTPTGTWYSTEDLSTPTYKPTGTITLTLTETWTPTGEPPAVTLTSISTLGPTTAWTATEELTTPTLDPTTPPTSTPTATDTLTPTTTATATNTHAPATPTLSATPTRTATRTATLTRMPTGTPNLTPIELQTFTSTSTLTATEIPPTLTLTPTLTLESTVTWTPIPTDVPSSTPTPTPTRISTDTPDPYNTPTLTITPTGITPTSTSTITQTSTTTPTVPAPTPAGLVAAYGFNEGAGKTAADSSGLGNTGTISSPLWTTAGKYGNALSFGNSGKQVIVPDSNSLDLTIGMTLEAWVSPRAALSGWSTILMKEQPGELVYTLYGNGDASKQYGILFSGGAEREVSGGSSLPVNTWTHLAVTFDGQVIRLYKNGVLTSSYAYSGKILTSNGTLDIGGNGVWGEYFNGLIDEVRIYNRALNAAEIQADMSKPL